MCFNVTPMQVLSAQPRAQWGRSHMFGRESSRRNPFDKHARQSTPSGPFRNRITRETATSQAAKPRTFPQGPRACRLTA